MKKFVIIFLLIIKVSFPQSGYFVNIEMEDQWWQTRETWIISLKANLYYNDTLVPPSQNYYYYWAIKIRDDGNWEYHHSGLGKDTLDTDQTVGFTLYCNASEGKGIS